MNTKKLLALLLALLMCLSLLPVSALAEDALPAEEPTDESSEAVPAPASEEPDAAPAEEEPAEEPEEVPAPVEEEPAEEPAPAEEDPAEPAEEPVEEESVEEAEELLDGLNLLTPASIPDANFRAYLSDFSVAQDGILTPEEAASLDLLDLTELDVRDLTGIKYFTGIQQLYAGTCLTRLDVSGMKTLQMLDIHGCSGLSSLNVTGCTGLQYLFCDRTALTTLDVSTCSSLQQLYCDTSPGLTTLKLGRLAQLELLSCSECALSKLDLSGCTGLDQLVCNSNLLTALDPSDCTGLTYLNCSNNRLKSLCVAGFRALYYLDCSDNSGLAALDLSGCTALKYLNCSTCLLTELELADCSASLQTLNCSYNRLSSLDVTACTGLVSLYCKYNLLEELDLTGMSKLVTLRCNHNRLQDLILAGCASLTYTELADQDPGKTLCLWLFEPGNDEPRVLIISKAQLPEGWELNGLNPGDVLETESFVLVPEYVLESGSDYDYYDISDSFVNLMSERDLSAIRQLDSGYAMGGFLTSELRSVELGLTQDYLMLEAGTSAAVGFNCNVPGLVREGIAMGLIRLNETSGIRVSAAGDSYKITADAAASGTYELLLYVNNGIWDASCCTLRVDVVAEDPEDAIVSVDLITTDAAVEMFRTDYTTLSILPVIEQNLPMLYAGSEDVIPHAAPEETGHSISLAAFTNWDAYDLFDLNVVDDRTLQIVPRSSALSIAADMPKLIPARIVTGIEVMLPDGEIREVNGTVTLTVKTTQPRVTASAVKLNSAIPGAGADLVFSTNVQAIEVDSAPDRLKVNTDTKSVSLVGGPPARGVWKLKLKATVPGYSIKVPVTVNVTLAYTKPKLTFSPSTVQLITNSNLSATSRLPLPAELKDADVFVSRIVMGSRTYYPESSDCPLDVVIDRECGSFASYSAVNLTVLQRAPDLAKGNYKVYLSCGGSEACLTVQATPSSSIKVQQKVTGFVSTASSETCAVIQPTVTGYKGNLYDLSLFVSSPRISAVRKGMPLVDVSDAFLWVTDDSGALPKIVLSLTDPSMIPDGSTLYVTVDTRIGSQRTSCMVKLPMKTMPTFGPSLSFRTGGKTDVISHSTVACISDITVKNMPMSWLNNGCYYDYSFTKVYDGATRSAVSESCSSFSTYIDDSAGRVYIYYNGFEPINPRDKYTVTVNVINREDESILLSSKPANLTLNFPKIKFSTDVSSVTLLRKDKYSNAEVSILNNTLSSPSLDRDAITSDFNARYPDLYLDFGSSDNSFVIRWNTDNTARVPATQTVKINLYLWNVPGVIYSTVTLKVLAK